MLTRKELKLTAAVVVREGFTCECFGLVPVNDIHLIPEVTLLYDRISVFH
jgi:hypothetical protein